MSNRQDFVDVDDIFADLAKDVLEVSDDDNDPRHRSYRKPSSSSSSSSSSSAAASSSLRNGPYTSSSSSSSRSGRALASVGNGGGGGGGGRSGTRSNQGSNNNNNNNNNENNSDSMPIIVDSDDEQDREEASKRSTKGLDATSKRMRESITADTKSLDSLLAKLQQQEEEGDARNKQQKSQSKSGSSSSSSSLATTAASKKRGRFAEMEERDLEESNEAFGKFKSVTSTLQSNVSSLLDIINDAQHGSIEHLRSSMYGNGSGSGASNTTTAKPPTTRTIQVQFVAREDTGLRKVTFKCKLSTKLGSCFVYLRQKWGDDLTDEEFEKIKFKQNGTLLTEDSSFGDSFDEDEYEPDEKTGLYTVRIEVHLEGLGRKIKPKPERGEVGGDGGDDGRGDGGDEEEEEDGKAQHNTGTSPSNSTTATAPAHNDDDPPPPAADTKQTTTTTTTTAEEPKMNHTTTTTAKNNNKKDDDPASRIAVLVRCTAVECHNSLDLTPVQIKCRLGTAFSKIVENVILKWKESVPDEEEALLEAATFILDGDGGDDRQMIDTSKQVGYYLSDRTKYPVEDDGVIHMSVTVQF